MVRGLSERAPDVLVMDRAVDERDHAAETRGQPLGRQMIAQEFEQLLRAQWRELVHADLVGPHYPPFTNRLISPKVPSSS